VPNGSRTIRRALVLVGTLVLTSACQVSFGGGDTLDTPKLETEIERGLEEQTDVVVQSVDCPEDVPIQTGATFTCTATADDGSTATIDVRQTDDQGNVDWELRQE
jgi:type 1 fimbria pilin